MSKSKHGVFWEELEQIFTPTNTWQLICYVIVSVLVGLVASGNLLGVIGAILVVLVFIVRDSIGWWKARRYRRQLVFEPIKIAPLPARGLILLVSPYSPFAESLKQDPVNLNATISSILDKDVGELTLEAFKQIGIFNSNLLPQIKAVEYHAGEGKLTDVWLISTKDYEKVKGSEPAAQILEKYIRWKYGQKLHLNRHSVEDSNYQGLWKLVEDIFYQADFKDKALVADVTGGTKMMSVAVAIACIPEGRRMQYMDSQRDWKGEPLKKGEMSPVVIDIDPLLYLPVEK
jgi:CRISPR-associated protein (Cas_Cas02710)